LVGIKGHRKHAKRQADYWGEFVRVADPKVYNAPPEAIVYEYHIKDATTLKAWTAQMKVLFDMGFKLEECSKMIGPAPVTIGIGIYSPGDKTKMKPAQCAMFRAEKDALKRRFDVKFHIEINGQQMTAGVAQDEDQEAFLDEVEGEYTEVENDEPREPAEIMEEMGITSEEPPTEQTAPTKSTASVVDRLVADKKFQNVFEAANALKRCAIKNATDEQKYTWAVNYHAWRECESTPEQAAKLANEGRSPS
jgi:hypothetical protein